MPGYIASAGELSRTITGKVVFISRYANTIALGTGDRDSMVRAFDLTEGVSVIKGGEKASIDDIRTGDLVTITYHQNEEGQDIIDGIAIEAQHRKDQA